MTTSVLEIDKLKTMNPGEEFTERMIETIVPLKVGSNLKEVLTPSTIITKDYIVTDIL